MHRPNYRLSICLLVFVFIVAVPTEGNTKNLIFKPPKKAIVLDPGHGGHDNGAKGPDGTLEKSVTLSLARLIATTLKTDYRVTLTRTDDYSLDILDRTAVANHSKADLFISLHTGGSFLHQASGISVFYFKNTTEPASKMEVESTKQLESGDIATRWDTVQNRHLTSSRELAQLMQKYLIHPITHKEGRIQGAPLMVLRGADLPAILIETGYLTNPVEEKMLKDPDAIAAVARKISNCIIVFLNKTE